MRHRSSASPPEGDPSEEGQTRAAAGAAGSPGRVLVVDDDYDIRLAVSEILDGEGYEVLSAANGQEALEMIERGARPSLILLDLMMPFMNGWTVVDELADREIPIIIFSSFEHSARTFERVAGFLRKPATNAALVDIVKRHLGPPPKRRITSEGTPGL